MTTGQRIQQARKKAGLSQKQLGEKLGLSASMIGQWENDLRKPKYGTLKKLADALDVWVYELSSPEDTEERLKRFSDFFEAGGLSYPESPSEEFQRITAALDKLNSDGCQEAVKRVEELTEIPRYRRQDAPGPSAGSSGDTDTPPPESAEGPPEGE